MRVEFDRSAAFAHDNVDETHRAAVQRTGRVDHLAVVAGSLSLGRLLCCAHQQDNAVKIELALHTPLNRSADTEAVYTMRSAATLSGIRPVVSCTALSVTLDSKQEVSVPVRGCVIKRSRGHAPAV